jgi:DNA-binding NarL/FixJ family response regulator
MMHQPRDSRPKLLGVVWVDCPRSVVSTGLVQVLEGRARVHQGSKPPGDLPSCVILCTNGDKDVSERVEFYRKLSPEAPPVVVFGPHLDLRLAHDALRAGASGFVHAEMTPDQLVRAITVATKGELVAPRELLGYLMNLEEEPEDLVNLSLRQREILELVVEGLSNAEIGRRLYLSESTIKQHLRAAYKLLQVSNRIEAANLFRRSGRN